TKCGTTASSVLMPCSTASEGSLGVVRHLPVFISPVLSSNRTKSVKVPPMSQPRRKYFSSMLCLLLQLLGLSAPSGGKAAWSLPPHKKYEPNANGHDR